MCRTDRRHVTIMRDLHRPSMRSGPPHCSTPDKVARRAPCRPTLSPTQPEPPEPRATASPRCSLRCAAEPPRQFHIHCIRHLTSIPTPTARRHTSALSNNCELHPIDTSLSNVIFARHDSGCRQVIYAVQSLCPDKVRQNQG